MRLDPNTEVAHRSRELRLCDRGVQDVGLDKAILGLITVVFFSGTSSCRSPAGRARDALDREAFHRDHDPGVLAVRVPRGARTEHNAAERRAFFPGVTKAAWGRRRTDRAERVVDAALLLFEPRSRWQCR